MSVKQGLNVHKCDAIVHEASDVILSFSPSQSPPPLPVYAVYHIWCHLFVHCLHLLLDCESSRARQSRLAVSLELGSRG